MAGRNRLHLPAGHTDICRRDQFPPLTALPRHEFNSRVVSYRFGPGQIWVAERTGIDDALTLVTKYYSVGCDIHQVEILKSTNRGGGCFANSSP